MDADIKWIIGIGLSVVVAFVSAVIGAFKSLTNKITKNTYELHSRVDEVKDKYVRRDDLDGHIQRIDRSLHDLRKEVAENHRQLMVELSKSK